MFAVEKQLSILGSYYFRLSTVDLPLMEAIAECGSEASYHYEEIATEAKAYCLRSAEEVSARLPRIRQEFQENLHRLRDKTGLQMTTVASHGDWANRRLGVANTEILNCAELRRHLGVQAEAYDQALLNFVSARYADIASPARWVARCVAQPAPGQGSLRNGAPGTPMAAVCDGVPVLYILLHPEQWQRGPVSHLKEHARRVKEAVTYQLRMPTPSSRR
jgi:hypothetical protein